MKNVDIRELTFEEVKEVLRKVLDELNMNIQRIEGYGTSEFHIHGEKDF